MDANSVINLSWKNVLEQIVAVDASFESSEIIGQLSLDRSKVACPSFHEQFVGDVIECFHQYTKISDYNLYADVNMPLIKPRSITTIEKDTPRTYDAFKSDGMRQRADFEKILRSFLIVSSSLCGGEYCQGWNFSAGSYCIRQDEDIHQQFAKYMIALKIRGLVVLYRKSFALDKFVTEFRWQLQHCANTRLACSQMDRFGYSPTMYAMEWFLTSFATYLPMESLRLVQDMMLVGVSNTLLKVGVTIIAILADSIVKCQGIETI